MENELLVLLAVIPCFFLWDTKYRALSLVLAGDFVFFFGFEEWLLASSIEGGVWEDIFKGFVYTGLCAIYLSIKEKTAYWLAGLSGLIGVAHCADPLLLLGLSTHYGFVMGVYCVLQLVIFYMGVRYELFHRDHSRNIRTNSHHSGHKGA